MQLGTTGGVVLCCVAWFRPSNVVLKSDPSDPRGFVAKVRAPIVYGTALQPRPWRSSNIPPLHILLVLTPRSVVPRCRRGLSWPANQAHILPRQCVSIRTVSSNTLCRLTLRLVLPPPFHHQVSDFGLSRIIARERESVQNPEPHGTVSLPQCHQTYTFGLHPFTPLMPSGTLRPSPVAACTHSKAPCLASYTCCRPLLTPPFPPGLPRLRTWPPSALRA